MVEFEGKSIGECDLVLEDDQVEGYETVTASELMEANPYYFASLEKAQAEVETLRFIARAYRAWQANDFALKNDEYVL